MINNIYKFYDNKKFNNGLFLIGAEHRKPIMNKVKAIELNKKSSLEFYLLQWLSPFNNIKPTPHQPYPT